MERLKPVDVVIVGGGWTGLVMAKEIATRTSLSVLVLERGGPAHPEDYATHMDELDYMVRARMLQNIADETVTHRHSSRDQAVPVRQYGSFYPGVGVGGAGEHWGGGAHRYPPDHFRLASHLREKFGSSRLPENLAVQDWGFTYDELEPCYWRAEQMMGVSGKAGNLRGTLIKGGNPFEGPRSHEFPSPPHTLTFLTSLFHKAALDLGYHPYPEPTAIPSQSYQSPDGVTRAGCVYCGYCQRYGCMIGAKAHPSNTLLPVVANKKNFKLQTGCWVHRILHRDGKAQGVSYTDASGQEFQQPADVVILSSFTLNNSRLLLLSKIDEPYDPAAGMGTLGKNLTHQVLQSVQLFFERPLNSFMGSSALSIGIADFAGDPPDGDASSSGVLRGGTIGSHSIGEAPILSVGKIPKGEVKSDWGSEWKKAALKWYDKVADVSCSAAHLSYRQNYVDLDPTYTDKFGDPLLRLTLDWTDHERRQRAWLGKIQMSVGRALGAKLDGTTHGADEHYSVTHYQSTHLLGGVIMGTSPETSVVNPWLQHWRMPNLWIVGGATFPQNDAPPPTLTIVAVAYRAADGFVDRYVKKPGALA